MMTLEDELKKAMGYTEDNKQRCPNCTHAVLDGMEAGSGRQEWTCTANKALSFPVSTEGRCDKFSAKRLRRANEPAVAA